MNDLIKGIVAMKTIFSIITTLLVISAIPVSLHADNSEFEEFSLTASVKAGLCMNSFSDAKTYNGDLAADTTYSFAPMAELSGAYNWKAMFAGLSILGSFPMRAEGKYQRTHPYYVDQYMVAALFEFGLCNTWTDWIYVATGSYAGTSYGEADHHLALGFGPCYRSVKSDLPVLTDSGMGWMASMRYQFLLFWDIGVEFGVRGYFDTLPYTKTVGTVELGIFYKII